MLAEIKEIFLSYHRRLDYKIYESFPLVTKDPTVLFTNATITPFKHLFEDSNIVPDNYAIIQRCLRVRGVTEDIELINMSPDKLLLFDMFGSCSFDGDYLRNVEYFMDLLLHMGLASENLLFTVPAETEFTGALLETGVKKNALIPINANGEFWQSWKFGLNSLVGRGITAVYSYYNTDNVKSIAEISNSPESFVEIGNLIHIYGREENGKIISIPNEGFEIGMGVERFASALKRCSSHELSPLKELTQLVEESLRMLDCKGITPELSRTLTEYLRAINAMTQEGVTPGKKQHEFILRKMIRLFYEVLWLSAGSTINAEKLISAFMELDTPGKSELPMRIIGQEEAIFRSTLNRGKKILAANPSLSPEVFRGTYGIRKSLIPLIKGFE